MNKITPVILAGGAGTRLWPVSRKHFPKQFSTFFGDKSLFQECAVRLTSSDTLEFNRHLTVTSKDFRFIVGEQFLECGLEPGVILIEPTPKNTAAAVLAATIHEFQRNPEAKLLVAPSDHLIPDVAAFHDAVNLGITEINKGNLVVFAIQPTGPETGYGYLKLAQPTSTNAVRVDSFVEKPELPAATRMIEDESYFWNAGIFLFRAKNMLDAFEKHQPNLIDSVQQAIKNGYSDLDFFRLDENTWNTCENISIDHAIMEYVDNLSAVPFSAGWSDLGSWDVIKEKSNPDENGNVISYNATAVDCENVLLRSENPDQNIVGLGLNNINAIAMQDSVLIMDAARSQDVGKLVELLRKNNAPQADGFPWEYRPWGRFEVLATEDGFKVKHILVKPGGVLSLQKHEHRSENWIVVVGPVKVTINDEVTFVNAGKSIHVPLGAIHRMENPSNEPIILIEVQTGSYLGEDDIIRIEDVYSR